MTTATVTTEYLDAFYSYSPEPIGGSRREEFEAVHVSARDKLLQHRVQAELMRYADAHSLADMYTLWAEKNDKVKKDGNAVDKKVMEFAKENCAI